MAVGQAAFADGDIGTNLATIDGLARDATDADAELIVLPELAPSGYSTDAATRGRAEPLDGSTAESLAAIATRAGLAMAVSVLERDGDDVFNTAILINGDGRLIASHRKTHLFGPERHTFAAGDQPITVARIGRFEVGLLVCYEVEFPEMARGVALAGADIIAVPTATSSYGPDSTFARQLVGARATENNVFVAYANHCGPAPSGDYMGGSLIAGPRAEIHAEAGTGREVCVAELTRSALVHGRETFPYLNDRRPDLYP